VQLRLGNAIAPKLTSSPGFFGYNVENLIIFLATSLATKRALDLGLTDPSMQKNIGQQPKKPTEPFAAPDVEQQASIDAPTPAGEVIAARFDAHTQNYRLDCYQEWQENTLGDETSLEKLTRPTVVDRLAKFALEVNCSFHISIIFSHSIHSLGIRSPSKPTFKHLEGQYWIHQSL
jgi:hypothetical protein